MTPFGPPERLTQTRVLSLFRNDLGYRYLGDWTYRDGNSNVEEDLLCRFLEGLGLSPQQINRTLDLIRQALSPGKSLYDTNKAFYSLLRYGVPVKVAVDHNTETIPLIDWDHPENNDFSVAEEVTLRGNHERRPDLVLYINGLALALIELKSARISVGEGIRQSLSNQRPEFNAWFFSTVQFIFAGNDSEGLRYGAIGTPEKAFLAWKEDESENHGSKLDKYLKKLCHKSRFLELIHDFILFDGGIKKLPRFHQYFGIKAAQRHVMERKSGIIWHTQGSGKSIVMVLLARWILENNPYARIAIITDRDELDKQIEGVFHAAGETISRSTSGNDLMAQLGQPKPRLLCSLIHKFGVRGVEDFEAYVEGLRGQPSPTVGEIFVFVDECHRTQSGKLHRLMKAVMPQSIFIGFTGTPLLKKDRPTTMEVFGSYIHTYKFPEAVEDKVVLDLVYEARDIEQTLGSSEKIDAWFETKTRNLNSWQKAELKTQWGTMQQVLSSRSRMNKVVADIILDFSIKPRLNTDRGNALLVASSIYEACRYYELFRNTPLRDKCALITSYNPSVHDISKEETGANTETDKQFIYGTYQGLLKDIAANPGKSRTETYEDQAKDLFKTQPARMKLLVVVDKLLTGFDAPPCTYLYIDKSMQDHGLFQAICRTNRLDGEDKTFGYIVDYKNLLPKVENAISVYTAELDHSAPGGSPEVLLKDRLKTGRDQLDNALESYTHLVEPIGWPENNAEAIRYFCGNTEIPTDLEERSERRTLLYRIVVAFLRAYGAIADELIAAGYAEVDIARIKKTLEEAQSLRQTIRLASGETLDLKPYEADMRYLIDTYIEARDSKPLSTFENLSLLTLIMNKGMEEALSELPGRLKNNKEAVAEVIENNVRKRILKEMGNDPVYFERMSQLLVEIIRKRREQVLAYEQYLLEIAQLIKDVEAGQESDTPKTIDTPGKRALYHNLGKDESLALEIDARVREIRRDGWRGSVPKEREIKQALWEILKNTDEVEKIFVILRQQPEY